MDGQESFGEEFSWDKRLCARSTSWLWLKEYLHPSPSRSASVENKSCLDIVSSSLVGVGVIKRCSVSSVSFRLMTVQRSELSWMIRNALGIYVDLVHHQHRFQEKQRLRAQWKRHQQLETMLYRIQFELLASTCTSTSIPPNNDFPGPSRTAAAFRIMRSVNADWMVRRRPQSRSL